MRQIQQTIKKVNSDTAPLKYQEQIRKRDARVEKEAKEERLIECFYSVDKLLERLAPAILVLAILYWMVHIVISFK